MYTGPEQLWVAASVPSRFQPTEAAPETLGMPVAVNDRRANSTARLAPIPRLD
jgi:hypothetical protein